MAQLWEWDAVYPDGVSHCHQTEEKAGIASEDEMLAHLKKHYPQVTITALRRCGPFEPKKPRLGPVRRHAFTYGIFERVMRELGKMPPERKETLLERINKQRLQKMAGIDAKPIAPLHERYPSILRPQLSKE